MAVKKSVLLSIATLSSVLLVIPLSQAASQITATIPLLKCDDGTIAKWNKTTVTYKIVNVAGVGSNVVTSVRNGINEWSSNGQTTYILQEITGTGQADITVNLYFKITPGYILGFAAVNCPSNYITSVDISLGVKGLSSIGVQNLAAHEFGHGLGLGHASISGDLMYASFDKQERKTTFCPSNLDLGALTATSSPYTETDWQRYSSC